MAKETKSTKLTFDELKLKASTCAELAKDLNEREDYLGVGVCLNNQMKCYIAMLDRLNTKAQEEYLQRAIAKTREQLRKLKESNKGLTR